MRNFRLIHAGLDVAPILAEAGSRAGACGTRTGIGRIVRGTAHGAMDDIWLRARAREEINTDMAFNEPYWPVFYPAWERLPAIHNVVWSLMGMSHAVQLGGCLITRIPSGARILPHADCGWHAEWFQTKYYVVLQGGPRCLNICEQDVVNMRAGEIWSFENRLVHSVENEDDSERVSLIVSLRVER